ncbi:MAG: ribonuclease HII [Rhodospirillales bacterium]|nr:ribonuclease HII [Rhodospirillales bacterium]MSP80669.1 ribonuclease HII [Rhodospirillales bacterium]
MPDFSFEDAARAEGHAVVAGIDEAGRGPWAGPVVAAAVVLDRARLPAELRDGLDDSKKLSPRRRRELFAALPDYAQIGIGRAEVGEIDRLNILRATFLAMTRALAALSVRPDLALVDGPHAPELPCTARSVVGGDARSLSIAAASIVAKVSRDGEMAALARAHPGYGWERNAGYGTPEHRGALARLGPTPLHRVSFRPIAAMMAKTKC